MGIGEGHGQGRNPIFRARFLSLSSFLLSFLFVVLSLKVDLQLGIGFAEFTSGFSFSFLVLLWLSIQRVVIGISSRREELVFRITVLQYLLIYI